jgi:hypothetical protein
LDANVEAPTSSFCTWSNNKEEEEYIYKDWRER